MKKHCESKHNLLIDEVTGRHGCAWGLTVQDTSGTHTKPSYAYVTQDDLCAYPLAQEALSQHQTEIISRAVGHPAVVPPRESAPDTAVVRQPSQPSKQQVTPEPQPSTSTFKKGVRSSPRFKSKELPPAVSASTEWETGTARTGSTPKRPVQPPKRTRSKSGDGKTLFRESKAVKGYEPETSQPASTLSQQKSFTLETPTQAEQHKTVSEARTSARKQPHPKKAEKGTVVSLPVSIPLSRLAEVQPDFPKASSTPEYKTTYELFEQPILQTPTTPGESLAGRVEPGSEVQSSPEVTTGFSVHSSDPEQLGSSSSSRLEDYSFSQICQIEVLQKPEPLLSSLHSAAERSSTLLSETEVRDVTEGQVPQDVDGARRADESTSGSSTMVLIEASQLRAGTVRVGDRLVLEQIEQVRTDPGLEAVILVPPPPGSTRTSPRSAAASMTSSVEDAASASRSDRDQPSPQQDPTPRETSPRTTQEDESQPPSGEGSESHLRYASSGTQTRVSVRETDVLVVLPREGGYIHATQFQDDPST